MRVILSISIKDCEGWFDSRVSKDSKFNGTFLKVSRRLSETFEISYAVFGLKIL